jgi:hypothetical protein
MSYLRPSIEGPLQEQGLPTLQGVLPRRLDEGSFTTSDD